jgi:predicted ATPase/DNA-binding SARP family transcriptional activator
MLRIHLLGHLRLFADDQPLRLAARPRTTALWAYLLLHRDTIIPRDQLAFTLWPDEPEAGARADLRRHLHELRRALPPAPANLPWLLLSSGGMRWNPQAACWLDVAEFERLSADPATLAQAVALYSGDLLPSLDEDWALVERERLCGLYASGLGQLVAHCRARRDYEQAIDHARRLLEHDPLREDATRALIGLRYEAGDRGGALREYQRFEQRLREELDVAPMPETSALYEAIARNAPLPGNQAALDPARIPAEGPRAPGAADPPPDTTTAPPNNLPAPLASCIGRDHELALLYALIGRPDSNVRLLTLTGPGGVGKTRLSLQAAWLWRDAADSFPDGIFFVALSAIDNPDFVAPAIAQALGVSESGSRALAESLKEFLRNQRMLLVLDNFEQVVDVAPLITDLLAAAPGLRTIVTSRALLQVYGEHEFPVPPLALPNMDQLPPVTELANYAAVALFVERARAANLSFELTGENAAAVAAICCRLDGLPLAIELAAARSKLFDPLAMLARLSSRLGFLTSSARNLAARQQTLRATIDWSYHLLTPAEQTLFARLAVFMGSFTAETAAAICADRELKIDPRSSILDELASLVNQSIVRQLQEPGPDGEPRFRLLLTLREYGWGRLEERGEAENVRRRHARFFLELAERAEPELRRPDQYTWLARLAAEHDNLRAAIEWSLAQPQIEDSALSVRLAGALWRFWSMQGHLSEGRRWLDRALNTFQPQISAMRSQGAAATTTEHQHPPPSDVHGLIACTAKALSGAGVLARQQGDFAAARALLEASLIGMREGQDTWGAAFSLFTLGMVELDQEAYTAASALLEESLTLMRTTGDRRGIAIALRGLGTAALNQGNMTAARPLLDESLALMREVGDTFGTALALNYLGFATLRLEAYAAARSLLDEGLALMWQMGHKIGIAEAIEGLAGVAAQTGQPSRAAQLFSAAEALRTAIGAPMSPADRAFVEPDLVAARAELSAAGFAMAWEAGRSLSSEQAVEIALEQDPPPNPPTAHT